MVINEIVYNSHYMLRHFLGNNIFYENLKKEIPVLDIIQLVFNDVDQHYSWIVAGKQWENVDVQLDNAKCFMDNVF